VAGSVAEVARNCETVITMLPSTPHVEGTYLGADGMLEHAQSGGLYIDCSTIDPVASKVCVPFYQYGVVALALTHTSHTSLLSSLGCAAMSCIHFNVACSPFEYRCII